MGEKIKILKQTGLAFNCFNIFIMLVLCFVTIYPVWYVIINSFNEGMDSMRGGIYWWPRIFTIDNYKVVFSNPDILNAYGVTIVRTLLGAFSSTFFTALVAYGMSKQYLMGRNLYLTIGTITLFFGGGLIPTFLVLRNMGFYNNFLVYIVPHMFSFYTMVLFQAYYRQLPAEIEESAKLDGANDFVIFIRIIIHLSMPIIAAFLLFSGVYHWNDYFVGVIYMQNNKLLPIQTFLYKLVTQSVTNHAMESFNAVADENQAVTPEALKLATMVVTTAPIVFVYPFLQKYFAKGMMLGSVKG